MNEPVGASVQRPNKVDSYVVPLMVGTFNVADEHQLRAKVSRGQVFSWLMVAVWGSLRAML